jgi:hypothetical protein
MTNHISFLALMIIVLSVAASSNTDTAGYDADMTIRRITHVAGLKGSVDKDTALLKLGISQRKLEAELEKVPHPEPYR